MSSKSVGALGLGLVVIAFHGCGGGHGIGGAAGSTASGGAGTTGLAGVAGSTGLAGADGAAGSTGLAGTTGAAGTGDADGGSAAAGTSGAAGVVGPISGAMVEPTPGCGQAPTQQSSGFVKGTIQTMGTKAADCGDSKCGAWSYAREYFLRVPAGYDSHKPYPLVVEGPGCGGKGNNLYSVPLFATSVIRVGLSPSVDAQAIHATNPNQGCFDDRDGDDSVDFAFYEALYDKLAGELCFDRNRVFTAGNSTGARTANDLGCKYAGDGLRPVRGVLTRGAGLPVDEKQRPTCTSQPMAGMWIHAPSDQATPFAETRLALERAMRVNGCTGGTTYETAEYDPFSFTGNPAICKRVKNCPATFPLVICPTPISGQTSNDDLVNPGWPAFLALFEAMP